MGLTTWLWLAIELCNTFNLHLAPKALGLVDGPSVRPPLPFPLAEGHLDPLVAEGGGCQDGGDAAQPDGLAGRVELLQHAVSLGLDLAWSLVNVGTL